MAKCKTMKKAAKKTAKKAAKKKMTKKKSSGPMAMAGMMGGGNGY